MCTFPARQNGGAARLEGADFTLMVLSVERKVAEAKSRLVHVSLLALNLRLIENWRSVQVAMSGVAAAPRGLARAQREW